MMRRDRLQGLEPLVAAALLSAGIVTGAFASDLERAVDSVVEPYLRTGNFSGVVVAADEAELLVAKAYGLAQIELDVPNDLETVFHLASSSKPFTTAAILLLEQDGKLTVNDPLSRFVPGFPRGDRISLHHLMINSTGIPNINGLPGYDELARRRQTPESLIEAFRDLPPEFEPGTRYGYSNSNYNLLALVIERAAGVSFGEFLQRRIFEPLGMERSGHHDDAARIIPGCAEGYSPVGLAALERAPWLDWSVKTGNGSLYSTAPDLLRFARAISTGKLLSPESVRRMHTAHIGNSGYGWFVRPRHGRPQVHINGRSPGFTSYMGLYPEDDLIVIVLGNVYNSMADPIGEAVAGLTLGLAVEPPAFTKRSIPTEVASRIAGRYRFDETYYAPNWEIEVVAEDGYLFANGDWLMPHPESDTTFTHRRYTSLLEFETLENGRYQSVASDEFVGKRVGD